MKLTPYTTLVLFVFAASVSSAAEQPNIASTQPDSQTIRLQYRFSEGDEWHYSLTDRGTQTSITPTVKTSSVNNSSETKHYRVVQVEKDGSAILEVIVDRLRIDFTATDVQNKAHKIEYDTASDEAPPAGLKALKSTIGKPFAKFRMSPSGKVTELDFPQAIQQNQLKQTQMQKGLPIAFPEEPISIGDSWSEKIKIELQLKPQINPKLKQNFTVQTIYQLQSVEDGVAEIALSTIVFPRLNSPLLRGKMMSYLPRGTIRFDTNSGRIVSRTEVIDARELGVGGSQTVLIIENKKVETLIDPPRAGLAN